MKKTFTLTLALLLTLALSVSAAALEMQSIAGAGPSTKIAALFAKEFGKSNSARQFKIVVPKKSTKHAGGIANSDNYFFGRTGRPLNAGERAMNKDEIILAHIPIAFVVGSNAGIKSLSLKQLEGIMTGSIMNWKDVGGSDAQIELIGREPTEALFSVLKDVYPFFKNTEFRRTVKKDDHVVNLIRSSKGANSMGFGAEPNFQGLNVITVKGFSAGVSVGLVYDLKNKGHAIVKDAKKYAASPEWAQKVKTLNVLPPK